MTQNVFWKPITLAVLLISAAMPSASQPTAAQIIRKMSNTYRAMRSYQDETATTMEMKRAGESRKQNVSMNVAFARPNRLRLRFQSSQGPVSIVSNGKTLWVYQAGNRKATKQPAPANLVPVVTGAGGPNIMLQALVADQPQKVIMEGVKAHRLLGIRKLGPRETYLIGMSQPGLGEIRLWIGTRDYLLYQASLDVESARRGPQPGSMLITEIHKNVRVNPRLPAASFEFIPPAGVQVGSQSSMPRGNALVGKPAPDFALKAGDDQTIRLSGLKGKTVLLVFWATWHISSTEALPILEKLSTGLDPKGLAVLGINEDKDPARVPPFLQARGITFPILNDEERKVMQIYRVDAMPRIFIVGPDGRVKSDLTGKKSEEEIRQALEQAGVK